MKRDLIAAEDELEGARRDLTKRDLEVAQMVCSMSCRDLLNPADSLRVSCVLTCRWINREIWRIGYHQKGKVD